jgi:hypothetical protein
VPSSHIDKSLREDILKTIADTFPAPIHFGTVLLILALVGIAAHGTRAEGKHPATQKPCKILVLGFIGGTEFPNHKSSGIVQIEKQIREMGDAQVCSKIYVPYSWLRGNRWIMKHFPRHRGKFSQSEIEQAPKIIIYGHSLGGWATLAVARKLNKRGIPVELTLQVASVGITDRTVPKNVKTAANFYTNDIVGVIGTKHVHARDQGATNFLGNRNVQHTNHLSITRNPQIVELVIGTVRSLRESISQTNGKE